jgi:hypothetical protein
MAHFARIENGIVCQVIVIHNNELLHDGIESEEKGKAFCRSLFGENTEWVQTSYNGNPISGADRGPYAGVGFLWDGQKFIAPISPDPIP